MAPLPTTTTTTTTTRRRLPPHPYPHPNHLRHNHHHLAINRHHHSSPTSPRTRRQTPTRPSVLLHHHHHHHHPLLLFFLLLVLSPLPPLASTAVAAGAGGSGHSLGTACSQIGAFACHGSDPGSFTRCIEDQLHLFKCPDGLHFNTLSQTCDWPENADCGGHHGREEEEEEVVEEGEDWEEGGHNAVVGREEKSWEQKSWERDNADRDSNHISSGHGVSGSQGQQKNHPVSAAAFQVPGSASKPWWRPAHVDPKAWEDLSDLVEVPFDGSVSVSVSASGSNKEEAGGSRNSQEGGGEGGKRKSGSGSHGHSHRSVVGKTADKRPERNNNVQWHEGPCTPEECRLPNCYCPGTDIPGGLSAKNTPQMVMLTFDDEVSAAYYGYFQRLFRPGRYNPNGCPVRGCLFVSGSGTDYDLVYPLYAMGVEIASHTLSHKFPHTWWATASYREYVDEVEGMRRALASKAGVPHDSLKGFRVPFLQVGGDNMYKALYDNKLLYDTSMFTGSVWEGSDPVWPFTLDYTVPDMYCQHDPCPKGQYPGLWEIPVQRWYGVDGHSCAMPDGCTASADVEEDLEFFRSNFKRYYESNRAPFGLFVHARWFHTEHHLEAFDQFIDELMQLDDVYIVTPSQVIEWMKNPTPLDKIRQFAPWDCEGSASSDSLWR